MTRLRIAFHIPRMNWYRVLAALVDEALRAGHHVECWHNAAAGHLGANAPNVERLPRYKHGRPELRPYRSEAEFIARVRERTVDAIVDTHPSRMADAPEWPGRAERPAWVLVDAPPGDSYLSATRTQLRSCDLFVLRTENHIRATAEMMLGPKEAIWESLAANAAVAGTVFLEFAKKWFLSRWSDEDAEYFRRRARALGTPPLDLIPAIDPEELRRRWGLPLRKPVLAYLPSNFGNVYDCYWERLFMSRNPAQRLWLALRHRQPVDLPLLAGSGTESAVIASLRRFCDARGMLLVAKLKHSMAASRLLRRHADRIVGEEGYYPHTAMELYRLASLTVANYSSAVFECVPAGSYSLNVEIPGFPKREYDALFPVLRDASVFEGVGSSVMAGDLPRHLASLDVDANRIPVARTKAFCQVHAGPTDGLVSRNILSAIEGAAADT